MSREVCVKGDGNYHAFSLDGLVNMFAKLDENPSDGTVLGTYSGTTTALALAGMKWQDIAKLARSGALATLTTGVPNWDKVCAVYSRRSILDNWERGFIDSLYNDYGEPRVQYLSQRQIKFLDRLYSAVHTN